MSRAKLVQRLAEGLEDLLSDRMATAMSPVTLAQWAAVLKLRKFEGSLSDAIDELDQELDTARQLFEIKASDLSKDIEGLVDEELDDVRRRCDEAVEGFVEFLELLGISEHEQMFAGDNLSADDKLRRWMQLPAFRTIICRLATQICDEDDSARPYVFRPEQHDTKSAPLAAVPGWHAVTKKAKRAK